MSTADDELRAAARYLIKSRIRHFVFERKMAEHGADEGVWYKLLFLESAIADAATNAWKDALSSSPSDTTLIRTLGDALYLASMDVLRSLEGRIAADELKQIVSSFVQSFQVSTLARKQVSSC